MKQDVCQLRKDPSRAPTVGAPLVHGPTLVRLLGSLGPVRSRTFLDQLRIDLTTARDLLRHAVDSTDRAGLQRASHCLIALAGTVGAAGLEHAARALNLMAHAPHATDPHDMADGVAALATRLIAELDAPRAADRPVESPKR